LKKKGVKNGRKKQKGRTEGRKKCKQVKNGWKRMHGGQESSVIFTT
jgi:hypothetical protein